MNSRRRGVTEYTLEAGQRAGRGRPGKQLSKTIAATGGSTCSASTSSNMELDRRGAENYGLSIA